MIQCSSVVYARFIISTRMSVISAAFNMLMDLYVIVGIITNA